MGVKDTKHSTNQIPTTTPQVTLLPNYMAKPEILSGRQEATTFQHIRFIVWPKPKTSAQTRMPTLRLYHGSRSRDRPNKCCIYDMPPSPRLNFTMELFQHRHGHQLVTFFHGSCSRDRPNQRCTYGIQSSPRMRTGFRNGTQIIFLKICSCKE